MKNTDDQNASLDLFLRRLMIAPRFKRDAAIRAAMAILDGIRQVPPENRILNHGRNEIGDKNGDFECGNDTTGALAWTHLVDHWIED